MRNVIDRLQSMGANNTTVNFFIVTFILVLAIILVGSFVFASIIVLQGGVPPNWLTGTVSSLIGVVVVLLSVAAQTSHINGTAAKTASSTVQSMQPAITANAETNAQLTQQVIQLLVQLQSQQNTILAQQATSTQASTDANTSAVQENTAATQTNTVVEKEHLTHG